MILIAVISNFEREKLLSKTKHFFIHMLQTILNIYRKKCFKWTEGKGAGLHIFMRDVSAERSAFSRSVEYLQNTILRGDCNL